jgi:hypothetical protein
MKESPLFNSGKNGRNQPTPATVLPAPIALPSAWLEHVAGGLNPQPLPPRHEEIS